MVKEGQFDSLIRYPERTGRGRILTHDEEVNAPLRPRRRELDHTRYIVEIRVCPRSEQEARRQGQNGLRAGRWGPNRS